MQKPLIQKVKFKNVVSLKKKNFNSCLSLAGDRGISGSLETSSHGAGVWSWVPRRCTGRHQGWPDWDPSATVGGEDWRAHWSQEATSAVWEPEEGHAGELHFAQVCVCLCLDFAAIVAWYFYHWGGNEVKYCSECTFVYQDNKVSLNLFPFPCKTIILIFACPL